MSTAHIFYLPVILLVGIFAGYFLGRQASENEARERIKRAKRKKALAERSKSKRSTGEIETEAGD